MEVFVVSWETRNISGIFSTKSKAQDFIDLHTYDDDDNEFSIKMYIIDA